MDIYFFTGTGNSYWAAGKLKELSAKDGFESVIIPVDGLKKKDITRNSNDDLYSFVYPTHGFSLPWHMLKFMIRFPSGRGRIALVNNRAGMKMGRLFTPGLSGIAILLPMLIFLLKGYRISAVSGLDTPSNWISVHPGLRPAVIDSIFRRRQKDITQLWKKLAENKLYYPAKFFILLPLDLIVSPISIGYVLFGRFLLARTFLADNKCDGCGLCAARCPVGAIQMKGKRPYWTYKCESCMRCSNICPKESINSSIPLAAFYTWGLLWITAYEGPLDFIWTYFDDFGRLLSFIMKYTCWWLICFILVLLLYQLIFQLNKIKIINNIFAFTTPMKYWRHYIAPGFSGRYKKN